MDTAHVAWTDADRVGMYYLEDGPPPRGSRVIYDRAGSSVALAGPGGHLAGVADGEDVVVGREFLVGPDTGALTEQ